MNKPENTDPKPETEETADKNAANETAATDGTHPICQSAPDQEKCEEFVERLDQAGENIDKKTD